MRVLPFDLLVVTDPTIEGWLPHLVAAASVAGPRLAVQVRADAGARALLQLVEDVREACPHVLRLVNDRIDVAQRAPAHGVHLKENGLEIADARALLGPDAWIGASCHDASGLARRHDADYVVLGPFGDVPGKNPALGEAAFGALVRGTRVPVLALGGIDPERAERAVVAGAAGVAVVRAILGAHAPADATARLLAAMDEGRGMLRKI